MIKEIYAIKDNLIGFWEPYLMDNESAAHRDFVAMIQSDNAMIRALANYLDLYRLGTIDLKTGIITPADVPEFIARGAAYVPSVVVDDVEGDDVDV